MNLDLQLEVKSDNQFTAKCRALQSSYRTNILKENAGVGPTKNGKSRYGNMIENGGVTGSNFISNEAFRFAKQKTYEKHINKDLTIDEFRLFNNMLSSMPMCFNLFSDLRKLLIHDKMEASRIVQMMFQEIDWIEEVLYIDVEFIPSPISDYTNDKSAFDAMLLVKDKKGKKGLISIETKYTDLLGCNVSKDSEIKNRLVKGGGFFDEVLVQELTNNGYKQIHRNFLLTYAYAKKNKLKHFANVIISPKEDQISVDEVQELRQHMTKFQERIFKISLEEIVTRAIATGNDEINAVIKRFNKRYLAFE